MFQLSLFFKSDQRSLKHQFQYQLPDQDYYGDPIIFGEPAEVQAKFFKVQEKIFLDLEVNFSFEMKCARCLELIRQEKSVNKSFQLIAENQQQDLTEQDHEEDVIHYEKDQIDLEGIVHEQVLLEIPIKVVCDENCNGICSQCGNLRDDGNCNCDEAATEEETDPRLAKLKDWYQE
ncbi:MAG: DUF177 domain-containing protein [Tindallia sp. MSAO_Bac2]|nr:MAG: DUF177 domain-containing protein [Tindallia sp. MSAO_Bac2]